MNNFEKYTTVCWSGRNLLKKHSLDETGVWEIFGEDDNPGLHGPHYNPPLGTVEGKLQDVIEYAVELRNFWSWGGGGDIRKGAPVRKLADLKADGRRAAEKKVQKLKEQLQAAEQHLKDLL